MTQVRVCKQGELKAGEVRTAELPKDARGRPREALVVRDLEGAPRAYLNQCRHLPIPLDCGSRDFMDDEQQHLICVTHGALYRLDDGYCVWGPCKGTSLLPLSLVERDGGYWVVFREPDGGG